MENTKNDGIFIEANDFPDDEGNRDKILPTDEDAGVFISKNDFPVVEGDIDGDKTMIIKCNLTNGRFTSRIINTKDLPDNNMSKIQLQCIIGELKTEINNLLLTVKRLQNGITICHIIKKLNADIKRVEKDNIHLSKELFKQTKRVNEFERWTDGF